MALDRHRAVRADAAEDRARHAGAATAEACWCAGRRSAASATGAACRRAGLRARARGPARRADRRASRRGWRYRRACARARGASTARRCRRRRGRGSENWPCIQSSGTRRSPWVRCSNRPPMRRVCSSCVVLRKSGVWQASHSRRRLARSRVRRMTSLVVGELAQRRLVLGFLGEPQSRRRRRRGERADETLQRGEIEPRVAPLGGHAPAETHGPRPRRRRRGRDRAHRR